MRTLGVVPVREGSEKGHPPEEHPAAGGRSGLAYTADAAAAEAAARGDLQRLGA